MSIQPYSGDWEHTKRRIPWIQLLIWIFLAGVFWAKMEAVAQTMKEMDSTYVRRDVLSLELRNLADKSDSQTERIRLLENQIYRLRLELGSK